MLDMKDDTLRARLRRETAVEHDRLDAAVSQLDLSERTGFVTFLAMQDAAFTAMIDAELAGHFVTPSALEELREACRRDLTDLGSVPVDPPEVSRSTRAEAVDHIILGSRLGTAVLRPGWRASADADVRAASRYFELPLLQSVWRLHCTALDAQDARGTDADAIRDDARALFGLFHDALTAAMKVSDDG